VTREMPWPHLRGLSLDMGASMCRDLGAAIRRHVAWHGLASDPSFAQSASGPLKSVKSASPPSRLCALFPIKDYNAHEGAREWGG